MFNIINLKNMKVLAYKISTICLLAGSIGLSAQGKVGINTENPAYTLDVNGTVRIADTPKNISGSIMLGVDSNGQVVQLPNIKKLSIFDKQEIYLPVTPKNKDNFFSYTHTFQDVGIDPSKYLVTLLSATLVSGKGDDESPVAMKIVSIADKNTRLGVVETDETWTNRITNIKDWPSKTTGYIGKRDRVGANDNDHIIQGTTAKTLTAEKQEDRIRVPFFYETPLLEMIEYNNRWYFRGEYDFTAPLETSNKQLYWKLQLFVIKKSWVKVFNNNLKVSFPANTNNPSVTVTSMDANSAYPVVE